MCPPILRAALLSLTLSLISASAALAAPPPLPNSPYGIVTDNGVNVTDGTVITAWCDGVVYRQAATLGYSGQSWYYNLDIPGDDPETIEVKEGCAPGETISFKIGALWATQTTSWVSGAAPRLDLTTSSGAATPTPTATGTRTSTPAATAQSTASATPTTPAIATATRTPTAAATATRTATATATATRTPTATATATRTPTATATATRTPTVPAAQTDTPAVGGLIAGLVDYWKFDESGGSVSGAHAGKTFTEAGSVAANTGRVYATAREYDGPGATDKHTRDNDDVRFGDQDFTVALWWYQDTTPDGGYPYMYHYLIHQDGWDGGYTIGLNGGNELFFVSGSGDGGADTLHSPVLSTPNGVWHFGICWYTAADNALHIAVDNGAETSVSGASRAKGTNPVRIGGDSGADNTMSGRIGPILMWNRTLSVGERTQLWNGGSGLTYEAVQAGAATATSQPTHTPTRTPTATATATRTATATATRTATATSQPTHTPTRTPTAAATATRTPTTTATAVPTTQSSLIFADGVECGSFAAWSSSVTNNGALSANPAAALAGTYGIQANVNSNSAIFVRDDSPASESRYQTRFHFDPNSIGMASGNAHYIFYGYAGTTKIVFRVEFRYSTPNYQLRAGLVNNASGWKTSRWINISDAPHLIEINWQAATASGASDGYLTLWIDDVQRATLTGVANSGRRIDMVRLGAVAGIDTNTRGTYHFDAFESSRQTRVESLGSQTALPTVAPIAIALDTSEVTLAWQHASAYAEYEVWRNASPLFDPNDPDSVAVRVANIPAPAASQSVSYGDHTVVSGQSHFYQVIGVTDEGATATLASDVGLIYMALEAN